jgi:hypothetical protein
VELDFPRDPLDRPEELDFARDPLDLPEELDFARDPLDWPDDPLRLPLLLLSLPLARFEVELLPRLLADVRLRPEVVDCAGLSRRSSEESLWSSAPACSSSSFPISFFATPTAAGTATPMAAPAMTFLPVDMPSVSVSFSCSIWTSVRLLASSATHARR